MRYNEYPGNFLPNPRRCYRSFRTLKETLQYFSVENSLIAFGPLNIIISSNLKHLQDFIAVRKDIQVSSISTFFIPILDLIEPIFSTAFSIYEIPSMLFLYWSSPTNEILFHLIPPNKFIPNDAQLSIKSAYRGELPSLTYEQTVVAWMLPSNVSNVPLVNINCEFRTLMAHHSSTWSGNNLCCAFNLHFL